jgi:hypothetical protein
MDMQQLLDEDWLRETLGEKPDQMTNSSTTNPIAPGTV